MEENFNIPEMIAKYTVETGKKIGKSITIEYNEQIDMIEVYVAPGIDAEIPAYIASDLADLHTYLDGINYCYDILTEGK